VKNGKKSLVPSLPTAHSLFFTRFLTRFFLCGLRDLRGEKALV